MFRSAAQVDRAPVPINQNEGPEMKQGETGETEEDGLSGHSIAASIKATPISVLAPHRLPPNP